jgi:NADPH:quinone reductase-like Zn-dependent oxidoreductase
LLGGSSRQVRAQLLSLFVGQRLGTFVASEKAVDLITLGDLIGAGRLTPAIDRSYPLAETPAAIRHLMDSRARGKLVLSVSSRSVQSPDPGSTP